MSFKFLYADMKAFRFPAATPTGVEHYLPLTWKLTTATSPISISYIYAYFAGPLPGLDYGEKMGPSGIMVIDQKTDKHMVGSTE